MFQFAVLHLHVLKFVFVLGCAYDLGLIVGVLLYLTLTVNIM